MTDIELRLGADTVDATRGLGSFRAEYQKLVKEVEKPLRQINAFRSLEDDLDSGARKITDARSKIRDLGNELARTATPSDRLKQSYRNAVSELQRLERAQDQQRTSLSSMRDELQNAGIDTTRLASEQAKLRKALSQRMNLGRQDSALSKSTDAFGITRLRELESRLTSLPKAYERLAQAGRLSAREQVVAQQQLQKQLAATRLEIQSLTEAQDGAGGGAGGGASGAAENAASAGGAVKDMLEAGVKGFVAISAVEVVSSYVRASDTLKKLQAQLKLTTDNQQEFNVAQEALKRIAEQNQAPLTSLYQLYSRISPAMKEAGRSQADTIGLTEAVTAAMRISGATAEESENAIIQFAQALGAGALRGDEFNSVAEQAPRLMRALADGIGVTRGALKAMADDGKLTVDVVVNGLLKSLPDLKREAEQLPQTFEGSWTGLKNSAIAAAGAIEDLVGFTDGLTKRMRLLTTATSRAANYLDAFNKKGWKGFSDAAYLNSARDSVDYWQDRVTAIRKAMDELNENGRVSVTSFATLGMWNKSQLEEALANAENFEKESKQILKRIESNQDGSLKGMARQVANYNAEVSRARRADVDNLKATANSLLASYKKITDEEKKASDSALQAVKDRLEIQQRYKDTYTQLNGTGIGTDASYGNAQQLKVASRAALDKGDTATALKQAEQARQMLLSMQQAGQSTYGLAGFAKELEQIELAANQLQQTQADDKLADIRGRIEDLKQAAADVKNLTITPKMDDKAAEEARKKVHDLAQKLGAELILTLKINPSSEMQAVGVDQSSVKLTFPESSSSSASPAVTQPATNADSKAKQKAVWPGTHSENETSTEIPAALEPTVDEGAKEKLQQQTQALGDGATIPVKVEPYYENEDKSFSQIPDIQVGTELDQAKAQQTKDQVDAFAGSLPQQITVPVVPKYYASADGASFSQFPTTTDTTSGASFDVGGYTGPGGKYEEAGTVHRGEHVQPQEVVREPGALGFLERIRLYGFKNTMQALQSRMSAGRRGYATGGLVSSAPVPSIPSLSAAAASVGGSESLGTVVLHLDGKTFTTQAAPDQFAALHRESLKKGHRRNTST